jgi:hypothetical protein
MELSFKSATLCTVLLETRLQASVSIEAPLDAMVGLSQSVFVDEIPNTAFLNPFQLICTLWRLVRDFTGVSTNILRLGTDTVGQGLSGVEAFSF